MKDVGVKMLKRESRNSVLSFHVPFYLLHVLNDINDWLAEETMKLVLIFVNCALKKKKLILTQVMSVRERTVIWRT